ncbi:acyl-CoA--sterol O-acyltransferase 1 isoform X1 [Ricinus communis]|uniref:acyl-CoA--sterol O-acyltransferase 1 isoform X1 n=1 Tax=Ricinus communis TaxID=3988 RepID=UPI00201ACFED|nr:acyl-CoA--sterol O-acyltransferase 1 isoform X1 [Ricinus communis]
MLLIFLPNIVIFIYVYHSISDHSGSQRDQITRKRSRNQQKRTMEGEMYNFTKALFSILLSLTYCYAIGKIIPKGTTRFFCLLPVVCLFFSIPLNLYSIHLGGFTAFFISWLANFKLLLYAFGKGPLSSNLSVSGFLLVACLPIKIQQSPPQDSHLDDQTKEKPHLNGQDKQNPVPKKGHKSSLNYAIKCLLIAIFFRVYDYNELMHPKVILLLYSLHIYFAIELTLAMVAALARAILGLELEPQFNEPYLSTSLQDFWGRRWNIMVTSILRPTVYGPLLKTCSPIIGRKWAPVPAIMGTFTVSAIMHELIFYYLGRVNPTWEITRFFVLHGVCLVIEIALKKVVSRRWQLPRLISTPLTIGFVVVTGFWLFVPQILRCRADTKAFQEYSAVSIFLKNMTRAFVFGS